MLHHGDVTVGGLLGNVHLAVFDVLELDLLVLLGIGVHRRACEGGVERRLSWRLVAIAHQLQIQLGRNCGAAHVHHFMLDGDVVSATLERPGLDQLDAALLRRFKANGQLVFTVLESTGARHGSHHRFVGGEAATDQARLCDVDALCALVKQHKVLRLVGHVRVLQQLSVRERAAFAVKRQAVDVGGDFDFFTRCRSCWRRRSGNGRGADGRDCRRGGSRHAGCTGQRRRGSGCRGCGSHRGRRREECGLVAVVQLPFVPQQNHGKAKNHPQDGAANVVHEDFFGEDGWVLEGFSRENNRMPRGNSAGTGSQPPSHQGWQRTSLRSVR